MNEKVRLIEKREPIVNVLQEKGVRAAYEESLKRKREDEQEQATKKKKTEEVNARQFRLIVLLSSRVVGLRFVFDLVGTYQPGRSKSKDKLSGVGVGKEKGTSS